MVACSSRIARLAWGLTFSPPAFIEGYREPSASFPWRQPWLKGRALLYPFDHQSVGNLAERLAGNRVLDPRDYLGAAIALDLLRLAEAAVPDGPLGGVEREVATFSTGALMRMRSLMCDIGTPPPPL